MAIDRINPKLSTYEQFKLMTKGHQVLTVLAGIGIGLLTLGTLTPIVVKKLVKKFRKIENKQLNASQMKTDKVMNKILKMEKVAKSSDSSNSSDSSRSSSSSESSESEPSQSSEKIEKSSNSSIEKKSEQQSLTLEEKQEILIAYFEKEIKTEAFKEIYPGKLKAEDCDTIIDAFIGCRAQRIKMPDFNLASEYRTFLKNHIIELVKNEDKVLNQSTNNHEVLILHFWKQTTTDAFKTEISDIGDDIDKTIAIFLSCYQLVNPNFNLPKAGYHFLKKYIEDLSNKKIEFPYVLPSKEVVHRFPTRGDGSCGFHALLGVKVDGVFTCDAKTIRKQFCTRLANLRKSKELPSIIVTQLSDIYYNPEKSEYQKIVKRIIHLKSKGLPSKFKNLNEIYNNVEDFIKDKKVFNSYLHQLAKVDYYISQHELMAASIVFNKRVRLFQDGWGKESKILCEDILNPDAEGEDEVCIYYSPRGRHYERVEINSSRIIEDN